MKNNATRTIRSEEITIDVRICAALAANRGGEVYLAAIAPDMELTVITLDGFISLASIFRNPFNGQLRLLDNLSRS